MSFNPSPPPSPDSREDNAADNAPAAWLEDLRIAAIFFTRVPLTHRGALGLNELARAWRVVPAIGALIGLGGAVVFAAAHAVGLPPLAAGLATVLATAAATGALHEDGLGDFADGCGGDSPERRTEIMRDSRIGAYGALALIFSVGLRTASLAAIAKPIPAALALIAAHMVSRAAIPVLMERLPAAASEGLGAGAGVPDRTSLGIALVVGLVATLVLLGVGTGAAALIAAGVAVFAVGRVAQRLLSGYTGDVLGAGQQAAEIAVLLVSAASFAG